MKAYKRAKCECGYDTNIADGRTDTKGYALKLKCKKCNGPLKLSTDWIVRGQHNGETIRQNCGPLKKDADFFISECLRAKHTGGIMPKKEPVITWEEGKKKFEQADIKQSTKDYYVFVFRALDKEFAGNNLVDITPERLYGFVQESKTQGKSARTLSGTVGAVKRMFTLVTAPLRAKDYPRLHEAAMDIRKMKKEKIDNYKTEFFTHQEIQLLVAAASPALSLAIRIQAETGLRPGNVYSLKFADISEDGTISLSGDVMKNGKPFITSISKKLHTDLKAWHLKKGRNIWLFPCPDDIKKHVGDMHYSWATACRKAGLKGTPHKLRHSFASIMLANDVPIKVVSELMGHSDISITSKRYGHLEQEKLRGVLDEYQRYIAGK